MAAIPAPPPALAVIAAIDSGEITPQQAFEAYVSRVTAYEADIGAFAHLDIEAARAALPQRVGGPLKGLPVGIKDIFDTADMPTRYGTPIYEDHRPMTDAAIVVRARRAGGSLIGKTTTTPYANLDPTPTKNPRAPGHTPGGSSSGSAAAVAAGMVAFAIGTQTGGSVIRPASYCGIAGFKPSFRLLPTTGMKTFSGLLDTTGLMATTVADVAYFAAALSGRPLRVDTAPAEAPRRIGLLEVPEWSLAEPAIVDAVREAARLARSRGVEVIELAADPVLRDAWELHGVIQNHEAAIAIASDLERFGTRLPPLVRADLETGAAILPETYDAARSIANRARKAVGKLFEQVDVILQPAAPGPPPEGLGSTGRAVFNRFWTLMGDPVVAVPGSSDPRGLPLGLQVIGPFGHDLKALRAAQWFEEAIQDV